MDSVKPEASLKKFKLKSNVKSRLLTNTKLIVNPTSPRPSILAI